MCIRDRYEWIIRAFDLREIMKMPVQKLSGGMKRRLSIACLLYTSTFAYADFSGRGGLEGESKPDLVAPGVDITAPTPSGIYQTFTGTSFATPFVSGAAALMMEWGIVRGNDPYLYGEKVKAYLRRGARPLSLIHI